MSDLSMNDAYAQYQEMIDYHDYQGSFEEYCKMIGFELEGRR